jgi:serine/threonine protein kinase
VAALVNEAKRRWRAGGEPDAVGLVRDHPGLLQFRSLVVGLAYEEYCLREEAGAAPDGDAFAARFPAFRTQIRELIRGHEWFAANPAALAPPPAWPLPGDTLEGYRVISEIGRGMFARVYLASDPHVGRYVVLKAAPGGSAEARAMGKVRHPNVAEVYWAKPVAGLFVICMPFVGVATLQDVCDAAFDADAGGPPQLAGSILGAIARTEVPYAGALPASPAPVFDPTAPYPEAVLGIAVRMADALAALHRAGVVHADLKPSNVLVTAGGHPYLIDFNLAVSPDAKLLRCGGTLAYMPPEQLRAFLAGPGSHAEVGPQCDVFAAGVILHQVFTGRVPFEPEAAADVRDSADRLLAKQLARQGGDLCHANVPPRLAVLIERCLSPDPADRPASGGALLAELQRCDSLAGATRSVRASRVRSRILVLAGVSLLAAIGTGSWLSGREEPSVGAEVGRADPGDDFARGRTFLEHRNYSRALDCFELAYKATQDPKVLSHIVYCFDLIDQPIHAANLATQAIDAGVDTPALRNNRAYSLLKTRRTSETRRMVIADLENAIARNRALRAAHYNLALALYERDLVKSTGQLRTTESVTQIDEVMAAQPISGALEFDAAKIYAAAVARLPEVRTKALRLAEDAIRRGTAPGTFLENPGLRMVFANDPQFLALREIAPPATPEPPMHLRLVDPGAN